MRNKRSPVFILFFTMIVVMLGFGMIIPIMPFYVKSFGASGSALGALMATFGLAQFIFAPLWGSLSDRYGRKPILMIGILGNALAQLLFGLSTALWMLFIARALSGILSSATMPTAMAYISDHTSHSERSKGMGVIGAAMGIGMVIGPGLGGFLGGQALSLPFFVASGLSLIALALVFIILPDSPRVPQEAQPTHARGVQLSAMARALSGPLSILYVMAFLLSFGLTNFESVFGLYAATRYEYTTQQVGLILMVVGLISAVMQGGMTGPLTHRFGEIAIVRVALLSSAIGFLVMTRPTTLPLVLLSVAYFVTSNAMLNPSVNSLISKRASGGQGMAMGLANSFLSLGRVVGPLWAGFIFDINLNLPYLTGALIMLAGFVISIWKLRSNTGEENLASLALEAKTTIEGGLT